MKFLPFLKSAKSLALVAATIATSIAASNVTSTLAQTAPTTVDLVKNAAQNIQNLTQSGSSIAPQATSISLLNLGAYVIRYDVTYDLDGSRKNVGSGNMPVGKKVVLTIPPRATNIVAVGKVYTGLFAQTLNLTGRGIIPSRLNCLTTSGTLQRVDTSPICK